MPNPKILLIDDDPNTVATIQMGLQSRGYEVMDALNGQEGLAKCEEWKPDLVLLDLKMPEIDGIEVLKRLKQSQPELPVVILTGYGTVKTAVKAMKEGAYDYLCKPSSPDEIEMMIKRVMEYHRLVQENKNLRQQLRTKYTFKNMVGNSARIQEVYQIMERVLNIDSTILITGETGTGKEMVAKAIHYSGNRAEQPFYALNCAGMQEQLLENELFGHEKGAFTGADRKKIGLFEAADRGSLFLDEISEASYSIQAKFLRVLQDKEFIHLGGLKPIKVDVRLMAATNIDLEKAVAEGKFREDLFYRLNVVPIALPPLRERKDDILLLANYFLERYNEKLNKEISSFSEEAMDLLVSHSWPGNVRELENAVERAVILTQRDIILPEDLPHKVRGETVSKTSKPSTYKKAKEEMLESFDKNFAIQALKETKGNVTQAAKKVNLSRGSLQRIMKNYGIASKDYR